MSEQLLYSAYCLQQNLFCKFEKIALICHIFPTKVSCYIHKYQILIVDNLPEIKNFALCSAYLSEVLIYVFLSALLPLPLF